MQVATTWRSKAKVIASAGPALALTLAVTLALLLLAPAAKPAARSDAEANERYLSPIEMALSPDGRLLYVVCQGSDELRVVDIQSGKVVSAVPVGHVRAESRGRAMAGRFT